MAIKFKVSEAAPPDRVSELLTDLARHGYVAQRMFPKQQRPKLASIYVIRGQPDSSLPEVEKVLAPYRETLIEYVEGSIERHLAGSA
jgi:hypothetical protein